MKVKEFVKTILKDITEAVEESDKESALYHFHLYEEANESIDFDLAVVLRKGAGGKIGAEIFSIVGAKAEGNISEETVNRIKFRVLPYKKNR